MYIGDNGKRKPKYLHTRCSKNSATDRKIAQREAINFLAERNNSNKPNTDLLFEVLIDKFLESDYMKHDIHPHSYKVYKHCLVYFVSRHENIKCSEIDFNLLTEHKRHLLTEKYQGKVINKRGLSIKTAKKHIMYINRVFRWAKKTKLYTDYTFPELDWDAAVNKDPVFLDESEVARLLSYRRNPPHINPKTNEEKRNQTFEIAHFILATGRRLPEALNLKVEHCNFQRWEYTIVKHKTTRTDPKPKVFCFNETSYNIAKRLSLLSRPGDYVFRDEYGKQLKTSVIGKRLKKELSRLGIKNVAFKELRHTCATHLYLSGEDIRAIQEHLGHRSIKTTEIYTHITKDRMRKSISNPNFEKMLNHHVAPATP